MKALLTIILSLWVISCSSSIKEEDIKATKNRDLGATIPPHLRAKKNLNEEFPTSAPSPSRVADVFQHQETTQVSAKIINSVSDDQLVWTDPDDPDQNLGEVEVAFTKPVKDSWQLSYQSAQRLAYAEGKPLLIWFTDSKRSPICRQLDAQVLGTHEFKKWSEDNVVKLRVDLSPREQNSNARDLKVKYAQALRKKFKVKGNPSVLVVDLDGQSFGRYKGFRSGEGAYYLGRLKQATQTINENYFEWTSRMKKLGYRKWEGSNGVGLFAKLLRYEEGNLLVVEPNGRKTSFTENNLSAKDRKWITKEKSRRAEL